MSGVCGKCGEVLACNECLIQGATKVARADALAVVREWAEANADLGGDIGLDKMLDKLNALEWEATP